MKFIYISVNLRENFSIYSKKLLNIPILVSENFCLANLRCVFLKVL